jgi:hypothetical protein
MDDDKKTRTQLLDDVASLRRQLEVPHAARIDAERYRNGPRAARDSLRGLACLSANRAFYHMFRSPQETERNCSTTWVMASGYPCTQTPV